MKYNELVEQSKWLKITDQRELFLKVIIPHPLYVRFLRAINSRTTYSSGRNGFIGLYENEFVCYSSDMWGSSPSHEKFRLNIDDIDLIKIKQGFLGINKKLILKTKSRQYKFYVRRKYLDVLNQIIEIIQKEK
jgi:hypothetical protein